MSVLQTVTGKRPKLIGTDLDGTIVAHYGFISERTKIAFAAAHHTVLAHAASTNAMRAVRSDILTGPVLNQAYHVDHVFP